MPKVEEKQAVISKIKEKVDKAKSLVLVDARGLTVLQDTSLRKTLREAGVDYKVYKNSMLSFAIKDSQFEGLAPYLKGPTAVAISYDDASLAARLINKNLKEMQALEFKAGCIEGVTYDAAGISAIASIPTKEELLAKLLGSFKNPMASFARLAKAIADEKGQTA
ncbi:MAG: 50S ribosomal protein L10 [Clostridiales bacterium]|jgi:large subunit ribosomal protein L10|nr:50S ribosomal protein L10 [Clostridiales bacterium]